MVHDSEEGNDVLVICRGFAFSCSSEQTMSQNLHQNFHYKDMVYRLAHWNCREARWVIASILSTDGARREMFLRKRKDRKTR